MAFEKSRTIVIMAIPAPRSRERFRKMAETTPTPRKRALRTRCLSPQGIARRPSRIDLGFPQSIYEKESVRAVRYAGVWDRLLV
jgi:hypothetical protein